VPTPTIAAPLAPGTARPPAGTLPGIDVSHYQGSIDWASVASSGIRFAIAKVTDGRSYVDPTYLTNKAAAESNGIVFGAYHFARPDTRPNDPSVEADHFVDHAQLAGGNIIPVLDLESSNGMTDGEITAWMLAWLGRVTERTGVRPMVYTSPHGWDDRTGDTTAIVDAGYTVLWVAHWNTQTPTVPAGDWGGHGWTFWQYSDCGTVPGIDGCVDMDAFAGADFSAVVVPREDVTAPGVAMSTPVGGPATIAFNEVVRRVTPENTYVWAPFDGTYPDVDLLCRNGDDDVVNCETGAVRTVVVATVDPLVLGDTYEAVVNPAVVASAVVDRSGNPAPTTTQTFLAPTDVDDVDPAVRYAWRTVSRSSALGGSYAFERASGASASFAFSGTSVSWYTAMGPAQGKAAVRIDGELVGTFDGYAPKPAFQVPRRFQGLERGRHVITVRALGRSNAKAHDTQVVVDAFGVNGVVSRTPALEATWRRADGVSTSDVPRASVEVRFDGTGVDWRTVAGPDQGSAQVLVDGVVTETIDNHASGRSDVVRTIDGLVPGVHTIRIVVASGDVSVDGFTVRP
jgi:GH25 family lysozyme M1 (1,4-beta-N-acetylmuramidase)